MALDDHGKATGQEPQKGVWKSGKGKGRHHPKGRQVQDAAWEDVCVLLGDRPRRRDLLIEYLHLIQDRYGHLSAAHLRALAEEMRLSMAEVYEVASFYAHFDVVKEGETPPPALTIRVCDSLSCELAGAQALKTALEEGLDPTEVRVLRAPCMGRCDTAPVLELGHNHIDHATPEKVLAAIGAGDTHAQLPDYEAYETYAASGGYDALLNLRQGGDWEAVQEQLLEAGLRGLGGAGFPSGKKWGFVRGNPGPRYLAVNGDEGEPGTFKDRWYLERRPHLFLEGMLIAAWAVEAEKVFLYMRDEYPAVLESLRVELEKVESSFEAAPPGNVEGVVSHLRIAQGELVFLSVPTGEASFVVHLQLDPSRFLGQLEKVQDELHIPGALLLPAYRGGGYVISPPEGLTEEPHAVEPLPSPLEHLEVRYLPLPGSLPVGFRSFEVLTLATFTWAVILLVVMIIALGLTSGMRPAARP